MILTKLTSAPLNIRFLVRSKFYGVCSHSECDVADGLGMLVEQAALAFMIWFGGQVHSTPDTQSVIGAIRKSLESH
ncbi:MAG: hypothetical protein ACNYPE_17870 [Candidatus Azotimanducaceae bacterium WSBS_2022_MAG_OTU7]